MIFWLLLVFCINLEAHGIESYSKTDELQDQQTEISHCYGAKRKPLTLVSTLDGRFIALDSYSGKLEWSLSETSGPLLSSSLSSVKNVKDFERFKLVPSLDGGLFQIRGDKIETVPLSADLLLGSFQTLADGSHIVGGKDTKSYGIDSDTGKLIYKCSMNGCKPVSKEAKLSDKDVFVLRRTQQIVRAVDQRSGEERWNFSVGSYDVSFMEALSNHHSNCDMYAERPHLEIRMNVADGYVEAFRGNPSNHVEWSFKFDAPIAAVWKFHHNKLHPVDILRHGILDDVNNQKYTEDSILYLGVHDGQMYAQAFDTPPQSIPERPSTIPEPTADSHEVAVIDQPYIGTWRPYISSSPSRTAALMNENGLTVFNQLDYPFDNGFCMIALKRISSLKQLDGKKPAPSNNKNATSINQKEDNLLSVSIVERWKEILLLAVFISIFLQFTVFKFIRRRWMRDLNLKLQAEHETKNVKSHKSHASTSTETVQQTGDVNLPRPASVEEFSSRYLSDFDHLECIGKGGFGVVFKARNKIDGCEYAVKRIYLPNCNEAREKVTREVKALAKLDYPGIVRFYYSWWETPPIGWQEQNDKEILMKNIPGGPAVGLSKEWYVHIQSDEEDTFDRELDSSESGITIKRKRNQSSMSFNSRGSSKSIGDDPLGKKINNLTDIDDDLLNIDLTDNNDVFLNEDSNDDSFNVEFKDSSCSEHENRDSDFEDNGIEDMEIVEKSFSGQGCSKQSQHTEISSSNNGKYCSSKSKSTDVRTLKSRISTKLVGRCCCKSESCITTAPVYLYIQMQLCMSSTLKDWLNQNLRIRKRNYLMDIFRQILNAVEYCHKQGMMHRDLKPSNIFFASDGSIKIGDFGLVTAITMPSHGQAATSPIDETHTGNVGTHLYMSPEQVKGKTYNHKVDIYSLGLILFELLRPFSTQMERIKTLLEIKQERFPDEFEKNYKTEVKVLKWLLREDPSQRPEAKEFKDCELFYQMINTAS